MNKTKTRYSCASCNHISVKWLGCCPTCAEWNTFEEELATSKNSSMKSKPTTRLARICDISDEQTERLQSGISEWDRVLGGGILPGSFLILTGDPGIGKSTLLLQVANKLSDRYNVFYFSSEESLTQVKNRAQRLECVSSNLMLSDESSLDAIIATAQAERPDLIILDSIQNCFFSNAHIMPGSIGQLREAAFALMRLAKDEKIAVLTTGHITKDGHMAGPKLLEHMVDGVFYLQGEDRWSSRILRSVKNRFGTINETGFFEMHEAGLKQVHDINKSLLAESTNAPGAALISSIEGSRPLLIELQALCVQSKFGVPQRVVSGLDPKRVVLIAAILEKYLGVRLSSCDIFFKVAENFKIKENGIDLGIALALLSSYFQTPLPEKSISLGEISLTGQIKSVNQAEIRIREAERFGLNTLFLARGQQITQTSCSTCLFRHVYELLTLFPEGQN